MRGDVAVGRSTTATTTAVTTAVVARLRRRGRDGRRRRVNDSGSRATTVVMRGRGSDGRWASFGTARAGRVDVSVRASSSEASSEASGRDGEEDGSVGTTAVMEADANPGASLDNVVGVASEETLTLTSAALSASKEKESAGGKGNVNGGGDASGRETVVATTAVLALVGAAALNGGPEGAAAALSGAATGLVENHAPGIGGIIEDSFLGLLTVGTVYALWRSSVIPRPIGNPIARKSRTNASWIHVVTGAGGLAMALYGVGLERIYRESPGWTWMWVSSFMFMANALSYGPLMNIFKASKEGKYAMQLGYSFVASFQGVVWIAWSAQPDAPDWMFWAVMPYWYFSLAKLWESTEFVLALTPKPADPDGVWAKVTSGSRARLGKMTPDAATLTYVGLNAAAAIFDNCYMALYTLLGPEQFWHTSQAFNDSDFHLRLIKGTTGSLTVALLIFISTLGWRKQMPMKYAIWLNVILGSVGPWIVLFWHKLLDPSEDWFPQFVFDPAFSYHAYLNPSMQLFN